VAFFIGTRGLATGPLVSHTASFSAVSARDTRPSPPYPALKGNVSNSLSRPVSQVDNWWPRRRDPVAIVSGSFLRAQRLAVVFWWNVFSSGGGLC